MKRILYILIILILLQGFVPKPAMGADLFNQNYIISDDELFDYDSMGIAEIFAFLNEQDSPLKDQFFLDYENRRKHAVTIIYQSALENKINPKFILTMLQKEQGLIENSSRNQNNYDWAVGYGVCDGCSLDDPKIQDFRGFGNQVHYLGKIFQKYLAFPELYRCKANTLCEIDSVIITPANMATAGLYNYTPHFAGNELFWKLWQKYWSQDYPDGSLLQQKGAETVWYIEDGEKRKISSMPVLLSRFNPKKIIKIEKEILDKYEEGALINLPNYSLIRVPNGRIYLLVDDTIRYITSPEVFKKIGYNMDEVINVGFEEISEYKQGENITTKSIYPTGALVKNTANNEIFYVEENIRRQIFSKEISDTNYPDKKIIYLKPESINSFIMGEPVKFKDGELIKSFDNPAVYVISEGKRRPVSSGQVFENLGYLWDNIVVTNNTAIEIHPLGDMI